MSETLFTWGDTVRVRSHAPEEMLAGEHGEVVAVTEISTSEQAELYGLPLGSTVYQVEFGSGATLEIKEAWLEAATE